MYKTMKPTGRTIKEVLDSMNESVRKSNGRLFTEEEAVHLVDEIRKELAEQDDTSGST